jgi:hypothetical protein
VFGSGKRKYALRLIMARLAKDVETSISMAFLVMFYFCLVLRMAAARILMGSAYAHLAACYK